MSRDPADNTILKVLNEEILHEDRDVAIRAVMRRDIQIAAGSLRTWINMLSISTDMMDDKVYRVSVVPEGVLVVCFGLSDVDSIIDGHYDSVDALPNWVQERLAVLMITPSTPPTYEVEGVGRRISSHVFWVFAPVHTS